MSTLHETHRQLEHAQETVVAAAEALEEVKGRLREYQRHLMDDPANPPAFLRPTLGGVIIRQQLHVATANYYEALRHHALAEAANEQFWIDAWSDNKK